MVVSELLTFRDMQEDASSAKAESWTGKLTEDPTTPLHRHHAISVAAVVAVFLKAILSAAAGCHVNCLSDLQLDRRNEVLGFHEYFTYDVRWRGA